MNIKYSVGILLLLTGACWLWYFAPATKHDADQVFVGTNAEFQPFTFVDKTGAIVGFDIDVAQEVCNRLGKKMVIKDMSFDALIPEIQLGSIHMIAAGMTPTAERAKRVLFTTPHLEGSPLVLVMRSCAQFGIDVSSLLNTKRIAVNQGYTAENYAVAQACPHIIRLSGGTVSDGLLALASNQADCYIAADTVMKPFFDQDTKNEYTSVILPDTQESTALAVSQKFPELYAQVETVLAQMTADGTLAQLKQKWELS